MGRVPFALILLLALGTCSAAERIAVLGLFKDKALIEIDGVRKMLHAGQSDAASGVKLISADSQSVLIDHNGEQVRLGLEERIGAHYSSPNKPAVQVWQDSRGLFATAGTINGQAVQFIVDTGASAVTLNAQQARALGIDYRKGLRQRVETASSLESAYRVRLQEVRIGPIRVQGVDAIVMEGGFPSQVLLGMTFLGRLDLERDGAALLIRAK